MNEQKNSITKYGYLTADPFKYKYIRPFQKQLRKHPTPAEKTLWEVLRNKKTGYKFRRQHIISNMIVDFVCLREKLVIEIDGPIHEFKRDEDLVRTQRLLIKGFRELRFKNEEVLEDPITVAIQITEWIANNQVVQDHSA